MKLQPATPLNDLTEKQFQTQVVDLAKQLGWRRPYHTHDSRRSEPGFPDLTLVRDRLIFLELKRETGKLSDAQKDWLRALHTAGCEAYVARPHDLQDVANILFFRLKPDAKPWLATNGSSAALYASTVAEITPRPPRTHVDHPVP